MADPCISLEILVSLKKIKKRNSVIIEVENPYQQVIKVMGHSLAPFASSSTGIPAYGFGDNESGDWGVFPLNGKTDGVCKDLDEVLRWVGNFWEGRGFKYVSCTK